MNRAFVKDPDDAGRPEAVPDLPQSPHPNYVRPAGLRKLQAQQAALAARRDQLLEAGRHGDPHELALAQRDLRHIEGRLQRAILVDPAAQPADRVRFGLSVEVGHEEGRTEWLTLVGEDEAEPGSGLLSWTSPLAGALLNAEPGDEVVWRRPAGTQRLEILALRIPEGA